MEMTVVSRCMWVRLLFSDLYSSNNRDAFVENLSEMIESANAKWYGWFAEDEPYNTACFYSAELSSVVVAPVSGPTAVTKLAQEPQAETYLRPGDGSVYLALDCVLLIFQGRGVEERRKIL